MKYYQTKNNSLSISNHPSFFQRKIQNNSSENSNKLFFNSSNPSDSFFNTDSIQRKCTDCAEDEKLQKVTNRTEQEEGLQLKSLPQSNVDIHAGLKENNDLINNASQSLEDTLSNSKGNGVPLSAESNKFMGHAFNTDFGNVRIHTDANAVQMNTTLNAQAFTNGNDIYFNKGKYNTNNQEGNHLLAHELTHSVQQQNSSTAVQCSPETDELVEECLQQKNGNLLPGRVGMIEQINREVLLDELLGKDRAKMEAQIKQDHAARNFVCEAGVGAMLALYYNRDYKNRLKVDDAKKSFLDHPQYYSTSGIDTLKHSKVVLKKRYNIFIEPGDKEWSPEDIGLLSVALGQLTEKEIPLISKYHFIRWTSKCNQERAKDPDYECVLLDYQTCGLHINEVVHREYSITMYDCMKSDPDEHAKLGYNVETGADTITHEIGHAMQVGTLRLSLEKQTDTKKEYGRIKKKADEATTADAKASISPQLVVAKKAMDDADMEVTRILSATVIDTFIKLTKGKKALTPYAATNVTEAFAEAFMLFKVAPLKLQKLNKPLFKWFSNGGFI